MRVRDAFNYLREGSAPMGFELHMISCILSTMYTCYSLNPSLQEVEPMYRESDHMHITAITTALGVPVRVEYMDRGEGGVVNHHDFPEDSPKPPVMHILYRPGHYDLLYR